HDLPPTFGGCSIRAQLGGRARRARPLLALATEEGARCPNRGSSSAANADIRGLRRFRAGLTARNAGGPSGRLFRSCRKSTFALARRVPRSDRDGAPTRGRSPTPV